MNIEDRLLRLERSNRYYKVALALCLCLFMVSAKDVFIKDEIHSKIIYSDTIRAKFIALENNSNKDNIGNMYIEPFGIESVKIIDGNNTVGIKINSNGIFRLLDTPYYYRVID